MRSWGCVRLVCCPPPSSRPHYRWLSNQPLFLSLTPAHSFFSDYPLFLASYSSCICFQPSPQSISRQASCLHRPPPVPPLCTPLVTMEPQAEPRRPAPRGPRDITTACASRRLSPCLAGLTSRRLQAKAEGMGDRHPRRLRPRARAGLLHIGHREYSRDCSTGVLVMWLGTRRKERGAAAVCVARASRPTRCDLGRSLLMPMVLFSYAGTICVAFARLPASRTSRNSRATATFSLKIYSVCKTGWKARTSRAAAAVHGWAAPCRAKQPGRRTTNSAAAPLA